MRFQGKQGSMTNLQRTADGAFRSFPVSTNYSSLSSLSLQSSVVQRSPTCAAVRNPQNYYLPKDVSTRFGARLRDLRREHNLTQTKMALDFGIDRTFISDVERGRKSISLNLLEVLALGLNMSLSDLLNGI